MDKDTLHTHLSDLMSWRLANTPDTKLGGYYEITDDPSHNHAKKTLVNTCRGVFCLAVGAEVLKDEACVKGVQHGLAMLDNLADKKHGGYYWEIDVVTGEVPMREKLLYGHAFVLLATSQACKAGIVPPADVTAIWDLIEAKYWKEDENAYSDLTSEDWSTTDPYRGQNGVMHLCEALISAYKATGTKLYLQKASLIATKLCKDLPDRAGCNMVWEHYTSEWNHDWDYNRTDLEEWTNDDADPTKMGIKEYRPWGYLPGHVAEWAKLLLLLALVEGEEGWYVERAAVMMRDVMKHGWDEADGGLYYCLSPEKALEPMNDGKFMWPLAEGLAAARLLASYPAYKEEFGPTASKIWTYSEKHFIKGSTWLSRLTKDNTRLCVGYNVRDLYHPLAACYDLLKHVLGFKMLAPFIQGLQGDRDHSTTSLFNSDGHEPITSPRSLEAIRAAGYVPNQFMSRPPEELAGCKKYQQKRLDQWKQQRKERLFQCVAMFKELQTAAEKELNKHGDPAAEALKKREQNQNEKAQKLKAAKTKIIEKTVRDQLKLQEMKTTAQETVRKKEEVVMQRRAVMNENMKVNAKQKAARSEERLEAVRVSSQKALEESKVKRQQKEKIIEESQARLLERRENEANERSVKAEAKKADICNKQIKTATETRNRQILLLEKQSLAEKKLDRLLAERAELLIDRAGETMLKNLAVQEHVEKTKRLEDVRRERANMKFQKKAARTESLIQIKDKIRKSQQELNKQDRKKRQALATWKATAEITGVYTVPPWLSDPDNNETPPVDPRCLTQPPIKEHYASWVWNNDL